MDGHSIAGDQSPPLMSQQGAGRGSGEGEQSSAEAGVQMAQERAEPCSRRCLQWWLTAKVRGAARGGEERLPMVSKSQLAVVQHACTYRYPAPCVCTVHSQSRVQPIPRTPCPTHVPTATQQLPQPPGPARHSQPEPRHVPAHARGHACSYVLRLLTLSALINTSGEAGGR